MTATKFARIVEDHQGTITAQNDQGLTRVKFKNYQRLAGFQDEMVSRRYPVEVEGDAVIIQL